MIDQRFTPPPDSVLWTLLTNFSLGTYSTSYWLMRLDFENMRLQRPDGFRPESHVGAASNDSRSQRAFVSGRELQTIISSDASPVIQEGAGHLSFEEVFPDYWNMLLQISRLKRESDTPCWLAVAVNDQGRIGHDSSGPAAAIIGNNGQAIAASWIQDGQSPQLQLTWDVDGNLSFVHRGVPPCLQDECPVITEIYSGPDNARWRKDTFHLGSGESTQVREEYTLLTSDNAYNPKVLAVCAINQNKAAWQLYGQDVTLAGIPQPQNTNKETINPQMIDCQVEHCPASQAPSAAHLPSSWMQAPRSSGTFSGGLINDAAELFNGFKIAIQCSQRPQRTTPAMSDAAQQAATETSTPLGEAHQVRTLPEHS